MTLKDDVKAYLEKTHEPQGPTQIGLALGFPYERASSKVNGALKSLVADGWAIRYENPVRYGKHPVKIAAPKSPLVERVAAALCGWRNGKRSVTTLNQLPEVERDAYRDQAHAAITACQAEELAVALRRMRREYGAHMTLPGETLVLVDALLAKLDDRA